MHHPQLAGAQFCEALWIFSGPIKVSSTLTLDFFTWIMSHLLSVLATNYLSRARKQLDVWECNPNTCRSTAL